MSSGFSFGFSGDDDSDGDLPDTIHQHTDPQPVNSEASSASTIPPQKLDIDALLSTLPSQIAYNTIRIASPGGHTVHLPRRELFDIRLQIIAEDDTDSPAALAGLDDSDIRTNVYEGGFKTWECSQDLVAYLLDHQLRTGDGPPLNVIELGAGTAIPSLTILRQYLLSSKSTSTQSLTLNITDYNPTVLTHATLPNLLLTYASTLKSTSPLFSIDNPNPLAWGTESWQENGSLEITPQLVDAFQKLLADKVSITLIGGSWSTEDFDALLPKPVVSVSGATPDTLILASETIYSLSATSSFTAILNRLLARRRGAKALVAAKKVYFGVGGSVDGFVEEAQRAGIQVRDVEFEGCEKGGVRRCILEVARGDM